MRQQTRSYKSLFFTRKQWSLTFILSSVYPCTSLLWSLAIVKYLRAKVVKSALIRATMTDSCRKRLYDRRFCDHCKSYVSKSTWYNHQLLQKGPDSEDEALTRLVDLPQNISDHPAQVPSCRAMYVLVQIIDLYAPSL